MTLCPKQPPSTNPHESGEHCTHPEMYRGEPVTVSCGNSACHDRHQAVRCCLCADEMVGPRIPKTHGPFA